MESDEMKVDAMVEEIKRENPAAASIYDDSLLRAAVVLALACRYEEIG